jgi:hypothetical protein
LKRGASAARRRFARALAEGRAGWTVEGIIDDGERVTHLFPNDCYVAHLSIYDFVVPMVAGRNVLDAGGGAGYGAHHVAAHGARLVQRSSSAARTSRARTSATTSGGSRTSAGSSAAPGTWSSARTCSSTSPTSSASSPASDFSCGRKARSCSRCRRS